MRNAAIVLSMMLVAVPVSAGQAAPSPPPSARFGGSHLNQPARPYSKLFQAQDALKKAVESQSPATAAQPKIVCGMLIIPASPALDPKMLVTTPQNPNLEYKIRAIDPPICGSALR